MYNSEGDKDEPRPNKKLATVVMSQERARSRETRSANVEANGASVSRFFGSKVRVFDAF